MALRQACRTATSHTVQEVRALFALPCLHSARAFADQAELKRTTLYDFHVEHGGARHPAFTRAQRMSLASASLLFTCCCAGVSARRAAPQTSHRALVHCLQLTCCTCLKRRPAETPAPLGPVGGTACPQRHAIVGPRGNMGPPYRQDGAICWLVHANSVQGLHHRLVQLVPIQGVHLRRVAHVRHHTAGVLCPGGPLPTPARPPSESDAEAGSRHSAATERPFTNI